MKSNFSRTLSDSTLLEILALSPDATAIYTSEDIIIEMANDAMISFWGKDRTIIGMPLEKAVPELQGQEFIGILAEVWRTGITYTAKERAAVLKVNGMLETFYFDFTYRPILNHQGSTYCILHSSTDVTEQVKSRLKSRDKESEVEKQNKDLSKDNTRLNTINHELSATNQELMETQVEIKGLNDWLAVRESVFRCIFEQAPIGIAWFSGPELIIEEINVPMLAVWGRKENEVLKKPIRQARPELQGQGVFELLENVYATGKKQVNTELKVLLKDGEGLREAYVNSIYSPLKNAQGEVTGLIVILDEVTEQIADRKQREFMQDQFRTTIESADLGTWHLDTKTGEFVVSPRLKQMFGFYPHEPVLLETATGQIPETHRSKVVTAIESTLKKAEAYNLEYPIIARSTGETRWVRATGKLYSPLPGKNAHFSGVVMDITERKLDDLRKNDFIAIVSHELKTPLTSAKAYTQLLLARVEETTDDLHKAFLQKIERQIEKMNNLIRGFLDVARFESGQINLDLKYFPMANLIDECVAEGKFFTQRHQFEVAPCRSVVVFADRDKIGQVLTNFLSNAIKYCSEDKKIEVVCVVDGANVKVSVIDEGMGISEQDKSKLFDRFYRVESKQTKTISGFGIGLYLCSEIIKRHGGTIGVDSQLGQGSTFWFTLPLQKEASTAKTI